MYIGDAGILDAAAGGADFSTERCAAFVGPHLLENVAVDDGHARTAVELVCNGFSFDDAPAM